MTDEIRAALYRLQRLQEQNRANVPTHIAQRAMGSFTLHQEPIPPETRTDVRVVVYPQDPFVGDPEVRAMNAGDIRPGLVNNRVRVDDSVYPPPQPDEDGNYFFWHDMPEFDQVNSFYYTTYTLRMFERYANRSLPWAFPAPRITVNPHAGDGANAFYNEQDRMIGFFSFQVDGSSYKAAQSADVVCHEAAHAVLDGIRDLHNESFGLGAAAFHESFGDIAAVLVALDDDTLLHRLLHWTNGNLYLDNFIAAIAENLAKGVNSQSEERFETRTIYLRNALNKFTYVPFDDLEYRPAEGEHQLGRESHNYSRLFTGAFYDIMVRIYEDMHTQDYVPRLIALHRARDISGKLLMMAVELGPVGELDFSDMALAFLAADKILYDGRYTEIMRYIFEEKRGFLLPERGDEFLRQMDNLPEVRLPLALNTAMSSALFLEDEVAPRLNLPPELALTPLSAYRNAAGYAFLTYFSSHRLKLLGEQYHQFDGASVDAFGGLTLTFDPYNRLRCAFVRPVLREDERQIGIMTADLIRHGLIANQLYVEEGKLAYQPMHMQSGAPEALWFPGDNEETAALAGGSGQLPKLVKFPVLFDILPRERSNLLSYLEAWL